MKSFEHINATTVHEALAALKYGNGSATLIAGGTDLLGIIKDRILPDQPEMIINIKTIRELEFIKESPKGLKIGALAKLSDIAGSAKVTSEYGGSQKPRAPLRHQKYATWAPSGATSVNRSGAGIIGIPTN